MFIVIEGDNGTGKTTVGTYFKEAGYFVATDDPTAVYLASQAKIYPANSKERFNAFIKYNEFTGQYANKYHDVLIIRYWISTVTAAFADDIFLLDEALSVSKRLYQRMPKPDYIFAFHCDYLPRLERIQKRNLSCKDDNTSLIRDKKYRTILEALSREIQNWYVIDTTNISPDATFSKIKRIMEGAL